MPKITSNASKRLAGNPGKRQLDRIKPPPGVPAKPSWLIGEASDEWDRVIPILDSTGVLSLLDRAVVADYCMIWSDICRVSDELVGASSIVEGRRDRGPTKNVLWSILNGLRQRFDKKCELLGLAPTPRGRLDVPAGDDPFYDPHGLLD